MHIDEALIKKYAQYAACMDIFAEIRFQTLMNMDVEKSLTKLQIDKGIN